MMKTNFKFLHYLIIACLILFSLKLLLPLANTPPQATPHYSNTVSESSSRAPAVSLCKLASCYTLTEEVIQTPPYLFIFVGALFFLLILHSSNSPKTRFFKPPIFS
ncbi:MAG: hypothetical protein H0U70_12420 [Tatlockia sp.]|nr:hypothetical protein [Tatlockia sp.]